MTAELHHLIMTYGYWLMAFGALIEGETFLIAGGIAAQQGLLHIPGLILLAVIGSLIHDHLFFFLGRYFGQKLLDKKPHYHAKAEAVLKLFDRYGVWLILALRFAYGLRTMIPTVLGMSPITIKKFFIFDLIGGILWACTFIIGGYFLGTALQHFIQLIGPYEHIALWCLLAILLVAAICVGVWWLKKRKRD